MSDKSAKNETIAETVRRTLTEGGNGVYRLGLKREWMFHLEDKILRIIRTEPTAPEVYRDGMFRGELKEEHFVFEVNIHKLDVPYEAVYYLSKLHELPKVGVVVETSPKYI